MSELYKGAENEMRALSGMFNWRALEEVDASEEEFECPKCGAAVTLDQRYCYCCGKLLWQKKLSRWINNE